MRLKVAISLTVSAPLRGMQRGDYAGTDEARVDYHRGTDLFIRPRALVTVAPRKPPVISLVFLRWGLLAIIAAITYTVGAPLRLYWPG